MKFIYIFTALLLCPVVGAFGQVPDVTQATQVRPTVSPSNTDDRYRIGYQDTLEIQVFRHPELSRRVKVNQDGTINLFRLDKPIVAVCKTESELAKDIASAYEKDYLRNPEVGVTAVEQASQSVAVIGAVQKPGHFYMTRRTQLVEILAFAGGPDVEKAGSKISVFRPGSTSVCEIKDAAVKSADDFQLMGFNLRDVQEGKQGLWLAPGDVVSVMKADQVFVYGNVNEQGAVEMSEPLTLTRAIIKAKGPKSASDLSKVRVVRQKPGTTEPTEIVYNFKEIVNGKAPDPFLEPNDIVAISEDKTRSILNNIGKSLTQGIPSIFYRVP
jgi:polysaccharide biosynthesis/export protein